MLYYPTNIRGVFLFLVPIIITILFIMVQAEISKKGFIKSGFIIGISITTKRRCSG